MSTSHGSSPTAIDLPLLELFLPEEGWFAFCPRGIHGAPHATRVLFWSAVLAQRLGNISALRWRELFWAASVHDVGRWNGGTDRGHGERSAVWVEHHFPRARLMPAPVDLSLVAELCRWHEVPDDQIGKLSLELLILKDADGLDRCRIGDLNPGRLRFQRSLHWVNAAEELELATNHYGERTAMETLHAAAPLLERLTGK